MYTGTYGCGKTHLAAAIANARVREGHPALFIVVPDFLDHLRAAFNPQSPVTYDKRFEEVRRAPFLVLDDLGTESATPWAQEKLFQLLNYRYVAKLPTVLTTARLLDELDPKLRTRLLDVKPLHDFRHPGTGISWRQIRARSKRLHAHVGRRCLKTCILEHL